MSFFTDAIQRLRPNSVWSVLDDDYEKLNWFDSNELPPPTQEEIEEEVEKLKIEFELNKYKEKRFHAYPSLAEQLDMLYHLGYDGWKEEINKIKEQYPKPEGL